MNALEMLLIAQQAADENNFMGWLMLLLMIVAALALAWVSKMLRVPPTATPVSEVVPSQEAINPKLLVVLTAAATAALGTPVVVRRITFLDQKTVSGWAEVGRTALHWSHNLPRNP
jgi:hypothetical protein